MPKFLVRGSYRPDGLKGLIKEGATGRKEAVDELVASVKGKIEAFYYAFGDDDIFLIVDLPDNIAAAALSLGINAAGMASVKYTPLLTLAEIDAACKTTVKYRPPKP